MALKPDTPERQALVLFTRFFDGEFTEAELISALAELPKEFAESLPEASPSWPDRQLCLRNQVLKLQAAIAEGRTIIVGSNCP